MEKKILIPIAQGSEELETVTISNLLKRASCRVSIAGDNEIVTMARNTKLIPDKLFDNIRDYTWDAILLPGGIKGVNELISNTVFEEILTSHFSSGKLIGAICAAPLVLKAFKILRKESILTSHPNFKFEFKEYNYSESSVLVDKNLVTSRGVGTAIPFTLKIIEILTSKEVSDKVAKEIVYQA